MEKPTESLRESLAKYEPPSVRNLGPAIDEWESALDCTVCDRERRYIDFSSGLMMSNCGHNDIGATIQLFGRTGAWFAPTRARLRAYQALESVLPSYLDRFILNVTGGEAVETALKIAMVYQGCDIYAVAMADAPTYHGNHHILRSAWAGLTESALPSDTIRVVLLCPFEGPTCRWWSKDFMAKVKEWQADGGIVIFDECQAGMGRTGNWWGFHHYGIEPDLVVMGKSLGNGWPISAVAGRHEIMNSVQGDFVSTYSGNWHCCEALTQTVDTIKSGGLVSRALILGERVKTWAWNHGYAINGKGLAQAMNFGSRAKGIIKTALDMGLILLDTSAAGTVKIAPPLTITDAMLEDGLGILYRAIGDSE